MKSIKKGMAVMFMLMVSVPCLYATHGNLERQPGTCEDFTAVYDTMAKYALDDSARFTSRGALNKFQQIIMEVCMKDKDLTIRPKDIRDFDWDEIGDVENRLGKFKNYVDSEQFGDDAYLYTMDLEEAFENSNIKYDISSESKKKSTKRLILIETKKIEKLLKDHAFVFKYSQDLESSKKFIDKISDEIKGIESDIKAHKRTIEDFDALIDQYTGAGFEKFNTFLRKRNFKNVSPKDYAEMCKKIKIMRDGIIRKSGSLNNSEITLYRYTKLDGIVGMLSGSGVIPRDWLIQQKKKFEEKCKFEDQNGIGNETEIETEKKEKRTKEYNKMLADKIMALLSKDPIVSDRGLLSTSKSENATKDFGFNKLIITKPNGMRARAMDISQLSNYSSQEEILFAPRQEFKVDSVKETSFSYMSEPCFEIILKTI